MKGSRRELAAVVGLAWLVGAAWAHADAPPSARAGQAPTWYAERLTLGDTPLRVEHFWSKGARFRAEFVAAGRPIVTIVNGGTYYVIDRLAGRGVAIERSPKALAEDSRRGRPFGNEGQALIDEGAEEVKLEKVGGRLCTLYRLTDPRGRREVWITRDRDRLPVRMTLFDRASGKTVRSEYVDWAHGLEIPDTFFEPDPRVQLEKIGYTEYVRRAAKGPVGPAPVLYSELLHGPAAR